MIGFCSAFNKLARNCSGLPTPLAVFKNDFMMESANGNSMGTSGGLKCPTQQSFKHSRTILEPLSCLLEAKATAVEAVVPEAEELLADVIGKAVGLSGGGGGGTSTPFCFF